MNLENRIWAFLRQPESDLFESLALDLYRHQRQNNPVYDQYCSFLGTASESRTWKEIPAVPQEAFKRSQLRSFPADKTTDEFRTSGTTGEGYGSHFFPSLDLYELAVQAGWDYFKLPRHRYILLMQHPEVAPHSSLSRMGGFLSRSQNGTTIPPAYLRTGSVHQASMSQARACEADFFIDQNGVLEFDRLRTELSKLSTPVVIFGPALAFLNLFEAGHHTEFPLPSGSIVMETGGFKGSGREIDKADLYQQFADRFGIEPNSVWNEYGMTELSSQFYSYGVGRSHQAPPWMRAVIVDPATNDEAETGQVGLVRIVDLANLWSTLAIQTQDLAVAQPDGGFLLVGRDPNALPRGCSRAMDELLQRER